MSSFARDEEGSATVEMVIWLPFLTAFLVFFFDLSMVLMQSGQAHDVARNVTRQVAVGAWTESHAEDMTRQMIPVRLNPDITIVIDENDDVRFALTMTPALLQMNFLSLPQMNISFVMRSEIAEPPEGEENV